MSDDFDLERFLTAQNQAGTYDQALSELKAGRKTSHWMWFVFPQIAGLGQSSMAIRYAISGLAEARANLAHVGQRGTANAIMGGIDAMKLRSSITLFARAAPEDPLFRAVLDQFFRGQDYEATTSRL